MLRIRLDITEKNTHNLVFELQNIADMIEKGHVRGYGWSISGKEEHEEDEDEDIEE